MSGEFSSGDDMMHHHPIASAAKLPATLLASVFVAFLCGSLQPTPLLGSVKDVFFRDWQEAIRRSCSDKIVVALSATELAAPCVAFIGYDKECLTTLPTLNWYLMAIMCWFSFLAIIVALSRAVFIFARTWRKCLIAECALDRLEVSPRFHYIFRTASYRAKPPFIPLGAIICRARAKLLAAPFAQFGFIGQVVFSRHYNSKLHVKIMPV